MNDFDFILEDCLEQLASGASTLEECLARHPEQAARLRPLLLTASRVERGIAVRPSPAFKTNTRARLYAHMRARPRQQAPKSPVLKFAVALAALLLAFVTTGTAFAQSALPGDFLYDWKLTSEQVWRGASSDPLNVDIKLAERRTGELIAVAADPVRSARAQQEYQKAVTKLLSDLDTENEMLIFPVVISQQEALKDAGLPVLPLHELVPAETEINSTQQTPPTSEMPPLESPPAAPTVFSTEAPPLVPTSKIPPLEPPAPLPTIEILPTLLP